MTDAGLRLTIKLRPRTVDACDVFLDVTNENGGTHAADGTCQVNPQALLKAAALEPLDYGRLLETALLAGNTRKLFYKTLEHAETYRLPVRLVLEIPTCTNAATWPGDWHSKRWETLTYLRWGAGKRSHLATAERVFFPPQLLALELCVRATPAEEVARVAGAGGGS